MKIKELLSDPSKWTQQFYAKNHFDRSVKSNSTDAVCWCLQGAVKKCYPPENHQLIYDKIIAEVGLEICGWNDNSTRTFEDVKKLVEKLDI